MKHFDSDTLFIICSFLQPLELCSLRSVGKHYLLTVNFFLKKTYNTLCIEEWACPQCGDHLVKDEITYTSFYDILYGNIDECERSRYREVSHTLGYNNIPIRSQLLCDNCENEEIEDPHSGPLLFKYRGSRVYQLVVNRWHPILPWAFLFHKVNDKVNGDSIIYWNQFRSIISPCFNFKMFDMYNNRMRMEEDDEEIREDWDDDGDENDDYF